MKSGLGGQTIRGSLEHSSKKCKSSPCIQYVLKVFDSSSKQYINLLKEKSLFFSCLAADFPQIGFALVKHLTVVNIPLGRKS